MAKSSSPSRRISDAIDERGPLDVAAFMDLALYDAEIGYYARRARRSGRAGDFFTSVDVGPLFGVQIAEMSAILESRIPNLRLRSPAVPASFGGARRSTEGAKAAESHLDLVEAGAGDG